MCTGGAAGQGADTGKTVKVYFNYTHPICDIGQITPKEIRKAYLNPIFKLARAVIDNVVLVHM